MQRIKILLISCILLTPFFKFINAQGTVPLTLKVIDKTKGEITGDAKKVFGWVGMWSPNNVNFENSGSWYANFFDGYPNGNLTKTDTEWTWAFSFNAPKGGSFGWDPRIGTPGGEAISIKSHYGLVEDINHDINFYVSSSGELTGGVSVIFHTDYVTVNDINGNIIVKKVYNIDTDPDNPCLHASGKWILDGEGNRFTIRGIGLGNYMLLEPYMIGIINSEQTPRSDTHQAIVRSFTELAGEDNVAVFMNAYLNNYFTEDDVVFLKEIGFNAVRMSLHHYLFIGREGNNNNLIEKGFEFVERVLGWCEKHGMYLILDMHCAPGGQSEDTPSVSDAYGPGLFEGDVKGTAAEYQKKYAVLWAELARRFGHSRWIGGYDLTNEINYKAWETVGQQKVKQLYGQLTDSIRKHDKQHIIFVQGNFYGNDYTGLTPPWDNNMVYCFHHYWSPNTSGAIQKALNIRNQHNVPVWMGESGENSNVWFTDAIELLENNGIGWAWWSYKKMNDISGILSVPKPAQWDRILVYLKSSNNSSTLRKEQAKNILMEFAENTKLTNAKQNTDVIHAILKQPFNHNTKPFGTNKIPGKIYATEYDLGRNGYAYFEKGLLGQEAIDQGAYNNGWTGRNDPVDIEKRNTPGGNGFVISYAETDEWLQYSVYSDVTTKYDLKLHYAVSGGNGKVTVQVNGSPQIENFGMAATGGWGVFRTINVGKIQLNAGWNTVRIYFNEGFNLSHLLFEAQELLSVDQNYKTDFDFQVSSNTIFFTIPYAVDRVRFGWYDHSGKLLKERDIEVFHTGKHTFDIKNQPEHHRFYLLKMTAENNNKTVFSKTKIFRM